MVQANTAAATASQIIRFHKSAPDIGTNRVFRSDTVQYSVTYRSAFIPNGSIKAAAYFHSSFAVRLLAIKYPIKRTTLVTYTGRILRVNADRPKNRCR